MDEIDGVLGALGVGDELAAGLLDVVTQNAAHEIQAALHAPKQVVNCIYRVQCDLYERV